MPKKPSLEEYEADFNSKFGDPTHRWAEFVKMVKADTRPRTVYTSFRSVKTGSHMTRPSYYKWKDRAKEVMNGLQAQTH